jgi:hypothetical protein
MTGAVDIARAITDRRLLGVALAPIDTWRTWIAVLKAAFALPLTADEQAVFANVAGNRTPCIRDVRACRQMRSQEWL